MGKINLLDFLTAGDKIYTGGQVYEVAKSTNDTADISDEKRRKHMMEPKK